MGSLWQANRQQVMYYSATVFRRLLSVLSRPGSIETIPDPDALAGIPHGDDLVGLLAVNEGDHLYNRYALGALTTLLDRETTFTLGGSGMWIEQETSLSRWVERFGGARMVKPSEADFALFLDGQSGALLSALRQGTEAAPEEGATAFICVSDMVNEPMIGGTVLELRGPGIRETTTITVWGLPLISQEAIVATRRAYPLGVDIFLIDRQGRCAGLPRTTRVLVMSMKVEES
jgi:alpha-D-ribose 1-methylphosphonate 5-triphosphate synthase subunit PhnH